MSDNKINIFQDSINDDDVKVVIKNALGQSVTVVDYSIKTFSDARLGFLGSHRQLTVTIRRQESPENSEIRTFFVKCIPYDNEIQTLLIQENNIFYTETNFYNHILPLLLANNNHNEKSYIAQCYLAKDDVIVLDDLKARKFSLRDKFLTLPELLSVLTALANFHASTILAEKRLGKTFKQLYPDLFVEHMFVKRGQFYKWFNTGTDLLVTVAKRLGLENSDLIPITMNLIFEAILSSETRRNVVCHGDLKSYNILFDDTLPLPQCVLVDFQLLRYAPLTVDLLQLLYLSTRREFRDRHESELLKHYWNALCNVLRENDETIEIPSVEDIMREYEEMRVVGIIMAGVYGPLIFMDAKDCLELTKDSESFDKFAFGDRVDAVTKAMEGDEVYRDVIVDIVTEIAHRSRGNFIK